jgi:hypothetical protein
MNCSRPNKIHFFSTVLTVIGVMVCEIDRRIYMPQGMSYMSLVMYSILQKLSYPKKRHFHFGTYSLLPS